MIVYLINIFLIFLWSKILLTDKSNKNKKIFCIIVAVQWTLISGLRSWDVGEDTYGYYIGFERVKNLSWKDAFLNIWKYLTTGAGDKDPGYMLFEKVFQIFSGDYQVYLIFIALIFIGLMTRWIYKNSKMPEISFLIYSTLFYAYQVCLHRQILATGMIVFIGYELIQKRKYLSFVAVAFVSFLIHKSSVVFVLYALIAHRNLTRRYVITMSILIITTVLLGSTLYRPIALFMGFSEEQISHAGGGAETYAFVLTLVCLGSFILYPWIKQNRPDSTMLYNLMFLTLASTLLVFLNQSFMRVQQYFSLVIMIMIPEIILAFDEKSQAFVYGCAVVILVTYIIIQQPNYSFFFM